MLSASGAEHGQRAADQCADEDSDLDLLCSPPPLPATELCPLPTFHHDWHPTQGMVGTWACASCGCVANTGYLEPPHRDGCRGWSMVLHEVGEGHRLVRYDPILIHSHLPPVYACELCHHASSSKPVFAQTCPTTTSRSRTAAYRRLEAGMHLHPRKGKARVYQAGTWIPAQPRRLQTGAIGQPQMHLLAAAVPEAGADAQPARPLLST